MRRAVLLALLCLTGCDGSPGTAPDAAPDALECPGSLEACGSIDGPWEIHCDQGTVLGAGQYGTLYCRPGDPTVVCSLDRTEEDPPMACPSGTCADMDLHYLDTYDQYVHFDRTSLCQ